MKSGTRRISRQRWGPATSDAGQYVELLKASYQALKAVDPSIIVISGAPTPTGVDDPKIASDDAKYLTQMYAYQGGVVKNYFDVSRRSSGGLRQSAGRDGGQPYASPTFSTHPSFFFRRAEDYHAIMVQAGDTNKKMWATETGYDSNPRRSRMATSTPEQLTQQQQADYLLRSLKVRPRQLALDGRHVRLEPEFRRGRAADRRKMGLRRAQR